VCTATSLTLLGADTPIPADLDGTDLPADTSQGNIVIAWDYYTPANRNFLQMAKFLPNYPANTLTNGPTTLVTMASTPVVPACNGNGGVCMTQPGTGQLLDTLGDRLMYRATYRVVGGVESLWTSLSSDPDASGVKLSGVRWNEIRNPYTAPATFQGGVHSPDTINRWMGSIATDKFGNMLLGYSMVRVTGALNPSLGVGGRLVTDAIGTTLVPEVTVVTGGGFQGPSLSRWGDYTTMQIDPDGARFWYIGQYLGASGTFNWRTLILCLNHNHDNHKLT
jgi:hypothetical protein